MKRTLLRVSLAASILLLAASPFQGHTSQRPVKRPLVQQRTASIPLFFEANRGQTDPRVRFLSRSAGYTLFLAPSEITLAEAGTMARGWQTVAPAEDSSTPRAVIRMKLVGGRPSPVMTGVDELPGKVNYLVGNDPKAGIRVFHCIPRCAPSRCTPAWIWCFTAMTGNSNTTLLCRREQTRIASHS